MIPAGGLFGRRYCLTLTSDADTTVACYGNSQPGGSGGGAAQFLKGAQVSPTPLRIEFDVQKNLKDSPNRATVALTNMSPETRRALRPGLIARLEVGYQSGVQLLFQGSVSLVKTTRQVSDTITAMELMDGDAAIGTLNYDHAYPKNTSTKQIIADIAALLREPTTVTPHGIATGPLVNVPNVIYAKGYTAHGGIRNTLVEICKTAGVEWSIQDGQLTILPLNAYLQEDGELLSKSTGLLGTPSFDGETLTCQVMLNPRLVPGRLIQVQSKDGIEGTFKVRGGKYGGDSHGDQWVAELECIPMGKTKQTLSNLVGNSAKNLANQAKAAEAAAATAKKLSGKK